MSRFQFELDEATVKGLTLFALEDLREVPKQAAWMLRQAVKARLTHAEALRRLDAPESVTPEPVIDILPAVNGEDSRDRGSMS